jgi:hypothetical protein
VDPAWHERDRNSCCASARAPLAVSGLALAGGRLVPWGTSRPAGPAPPASCPGVVLIGSGAGLSFVSITTAALARVVPLLAI